MTGEEIAFAGAAKQAEMVREGEVSPRELVELCLDRIARLDPQLNSFRAVFAEKALLEAEQAEARLKAGEERPLLGVPVAIKDCVDVAGDITTYGTDGFDEPAKADSEIVRRLREAGAILLGKTTLPELAICGFTETATWGVTRNPWDPQRTPGGSSGGSAAAVAAGLVPIALATDGAGSIRIPAASCGLFGLKPQRGRVSLRPRSGALERPLRLQLRQPYGARHGPLARRRQRRLARAGALLRRPSGPLSRRRAPLAGKLRVAWSTAAATRRRAAERSTTSPRAPSPRRPSCCGSLGHEVEQRDPDWGGIGNNITPRYLRGIAEDFAKVPHPERLESRTRGFARLGRLIPDGLFERARRAEGADRARVNAIFADHDVLITPVMGGTALPVRRWEGQGALRTVLGMSRFYPYCVPWNHLGNPAMSVPAGFAADGMPLAVQIIGRPGDEATLLSLAAQLEAERPWADKRPPIS